MEPEEETLATIREEEEDDDEDTAMADTKNNPKTMTEDSSSDSSVASDSDSDSDSEDEAKQNMELQTPEYQLSNEPSNYDIHVQYIKAWRKMGEVEKLRQAREAMNEIFPLTPAMWQERARDEASISTGLSREKNIDTDGPAFLSQKTGHLFSMKD